MRSPRRAPILLLLLAAGQLLLAQSAPPPLEHQPEPAPPARLAPSDLLEVGVFQTPELTTVARLDAEGALNMPVIGRVPLAGASVAEAEARIAARLKQSGYLLDPQVQVLVRQYAGAPVTVLGAVRSPGVYWARQDRGLLAILAQAGGLSSEAGEALLVTRAASGPASVTRRIALTQLTRGGAAPDVVLEPGDVVRVLPAAEIYVGGQVRQPGQFRMPAAGLTLLEALSMAGGLKTGAGRRQTWIVHTGLDGRRATRLVDLGRVMQGRAPDPRLAPFDFVFVPTNLAKLSLIRGAETALAAGVTIFTGVIIFH